MDKSGVIVIFGITGDLAGKKLLPAIRSLKRRLDIVGFSRRNLLTKRELQLLDHIPYFSGPFGDLTSYNKLKEHLSTYKEKIIYLAIPPIVYTEALLGIAQSGLSGGNTKILIEKPFGTDLAGAKKLDKLVSKLFKKNQVYRVDHYLGKDNFGKLKFKVNKNTRGRIDRVEINLFERGLVGERVEFYDPVGAVRDVGQNHVLALLNLVLGGVPTTVKSILRGQYEGYEKVSDTETFFRVETSVSGIPVTLAAGKGLKENKAEIKIYWKDKKEPTVFPVVGTGYGRVIEAAIKGDKSMFPTSEQVLAQWKFTESVLKQMRRSLLVKYKKGSLL